MRTDRDRLKQIAARLKSPKVLVVGDLMLDRYSWCGVERISPEAPVPVLDVKREESYPGGACNVAIKAVELGGQASICGVVGQDNEGEHLLSLLSDSGVRTDAVSQLASRPTTLKHRIIAQAQQVVRVDREDRSPVDTQVSEALFEMTREKLTGCDVLVISDYNKGLLTPQMLSELTQLAGEMGKKVVVDPKGSDYSRYRGADLITPNTKEAMAAAGLTGEPTDELLEQCAAKIFGITECSTLVITRSEKGMTVYQRDGKSRHYSARRREVYDVTGAGDSVAATFALGLGSGLSAVESAELAMVTAGLTVAQLGVGHVTRSDLIGAIYGGLVNTAEKFVSQGKLLEKLQKERDRGRSVVFTNGCFDLIHVGHIKMLERSKEFGDVLVVAMNTDASVRRLKGANRPIISESARASVISSLSQVDYVTLFDEDTPLELIRKVQPEVLVKGGDYTLDTVVGAQDVLEYGGSVEIISLVEGFSTTNIVQAVLDKYAGQDEPSSEEN
mgnify:CR=1 FL=1